MTFAADSIARLYLTETCEIRRPSDRAAPASVDSSTLKVTFTVGELVYEGACMVEARAADRVSADGPARVVERFTLDLPRGTTGVRAGDIVQLRDPDSGGLLDRQFRIVRVKSDGDRELTAQYDAELATQLPVSTGA